MWNCSWNFLHANKFTGIFISLQVVEEAKKMIEASPNQKFVVHEFKADANAKVIEKCTNVAQW